MRSHPLLAARALLSLVILVSTLACGVKADPLPPLDNPREDNAQRRSSPTTDESESQKKKQGQ